MNDLFELAKAEPAKAKAGLSEEQRKAIYTLKNEKGFTWTEVCDWMKVKGGIAAEMKPSTLAAMYHGKKDPKKAKPEKNKPGRKPGTKNKPKDESKDAPAA